MNWLKEMIEITNKNNENISITAFESFVSFLSEVLLLSFPTLKIEQIT